MQGRRLRRIYIGDLCAWIERLCDADATPGAGEGYGSGSQPEQNIVRNPEMRADPVSPLLLLQQPHRSACEKRLDILEDAGKEVHIGIVRHISDMGVRIVFRSRRSS